MGRHKAINIHLHYDYLTYRGTYLYGGKCYPPRNNFFLKFLVLNARFTVFKVNKLIVSKTYFKHPMKTKISRGRNSESIQKRFLESGGGGGGINKSGPGPKWSATEFRKQLHPYKSFPKVKVCIRGCKMYHIYLCMCLG